MFHHNYFFFLADTNTSVDWTLRHGRGIALGIALKEGADKIWTDQYQTGVKTSIGSLVESDRVRFETVFQFLFVKGCELMSLAFSIREDYMPVIRR